MSYLYQLLGIWELDRHLVIRPVVWAKLHRGGQVCYLNEDGSKPTLMECLTGSIQSGEDLIWILEDSKEDESMKPATGVCPMQSG